MAGDEPEVGDKASWNWNGSTPSGEVSEKKTEGEAAVTSKRGNTIKKAAKPGDPAIALERSGNDVVKNQSELHVDEKKAGGANGTVNEEDIPADGSIHDSEEEDPLEEAEAAKEKGKGKAKTPKKGGATPKAKAETTGGKKRKATEEKEAAPSSAKKAKTAAPKKEEKPKGTSGPGKRGRPKGTAGPKKPVTPTAAGDRKPRGRPKQEEQAKVTKSTPKKTDSKKAAAGKKGGETTGAKRGRKPKA